MNYEISHEITEDDLELFNRLGFRRGYGELKEVGEHHFKRFKSWEDLTHINSPWSHFLLDPAQQYQNLTDIEKARFGDETIWAEKANFRKWANTERIKASERLEIDMSIGAMAIIPRNTIKLVDHPINPSLLLIGEVVSSVNLDQQAVLDLANARPWGRDGGLQMLCNALRKPLFVNPTNKSLFLEFIPNL